MPEPVDHILVETTGVADPLPVVLTFLRPEFRDALRLDAIVAMADAEQFSLDLFEGRQPATSCAMPTRSLSTNAIWSAPERLTSSKRRSAR